MHRTEPLLEISPRFTHMVESDGVCVLIGDLHSVVLEGGAVGELLKLLDGTRTAVHMAKSLSSTFKPQVVYLALLQLQSDGVIRECVPGPGAPDTGERALRLRRAWADRGDLGAVSIRFDGASGGDQAHAGAHTLLLTEDYLHPDVARALVRPTPDQSHSTTTSTLVRLGREDIWIGPTLGEVAGPCIMCLQTRLRHNLPGRALVADAVQTVPAATGGSAAANREITPTHQRPRVTRLPHEIDPAAFQLLSDWAGRTERAHEPHGVDKIDAGARGDPGIWSFPISGAAPTKHATPKLPHCPRCGDPDLQPGGAEFTLSSRESKGGSAGGLRILTPRETWDAYSPLIDPVTGIVREVGKVEAAESGPIHVYTASHASGLGPATVEAVRDEGRDQSGGKGVTDLDARVSALGESLERFSGLHRGTETVRRARFSDLGPEAFHPNDLMLFSDTQFTSRDSWNADLAGNFQWIPEPYRNEQIAWSPLRSLVSSQTRFAPSAFVFLAYQGDDGRFCRGDSNGLAGGNCLEEAILQGFFELVERDAVALWWYNRGRVPAVDSVSLAPRYVRELEAYYESLGRQMWTLDLTTDLGIPCIGAFSARREYAGEEPADGKGSDIIFGFGCHLDPGVALRRALTELNQMLPTVLRTPQERERHLLPEFGDALAWFDSATVARHPYITPTRSSPPTTFATEQAHRWGVDDAIEACLARSQSAGLDVWVHDLTRQDVGFSVAKVVVPGLRHFWRRTGPGRLYEVPPKLGWTEGPQCEQDLNPISMFV